MIKKAEVTLPSDSSVRVRRSFSAPRTLVYRSYTEPALVSRWLLGPPGWSMPVCEMDVRVGGSYRWRWRSIEGNQEFGFHGKFLEVVGPAKLVHTQFYDPGTNTNDMGDGALITVEFSEQGGVTTVSTIMEFHTQQARDAAMATGMTDGMEQSYVGLESLLAQQG